METEPQAVDGPAVDNRLLDGRARDPRPLDPRAITLWRIGSALAGALVLTAVILVELFAGLPLPAGLTAALVAVAAAGIAVVVPPLRYDAWRFALRDEHVYLRHGILFRTSSIVPYARVQHVDTRHGPIDRWLGLASLVLFTAGTQGAIITIPALEAGEAERLRDHLAGLSGTGDAV